MAKNPGFSGGGPVAYAPRVQQSPERAHAEALLGAIPGVQGVGEGRNEIGDSAWIAYVKDSSVGSRLPKDVRGKPVIAEVSGEIDIQPA
jgi:hypothetical protein